MRFIEESRLVLLQQPTAESEEQIEARDVGPDVRCHPYSYFMIVLIVVLKYDDFSAEIQEEFKQYLEQLEIHQQLAKFIISYVAYKKHEVRTNREPFNPPDLSVTL